MSNKKIVIVGPFTDDDVEALMAAVRAAEQKNPEGLFTMTVDDTEGYKTLEEAKEFVLKTFPAVEGVPYTVETYQKGKDNDGQ